MRGWLCADRFYVNLKFLHWSLPFCGEFFVISVETFDAETMITFPKFRHLGGIFFILLSIIHKQLEVWRITFTQIRYDRLWTFSKLVIFKHMIKCPCQKQSYALCEKSLIPAPFTQIRHKIAAQTEHQRGHRRQHVGLLMVLCGLNHLCRLPRHRPI